MAIKINSSVLSNEIHPLLKNEVSNHQNEKTSTIAHKTFDGTTNHWVTEGTLERAGWSALSLSSGATSAASYLFYQTIALTAGSTLAACLPVAFMTAAGAFALKAYLTPDYDNTAEVARYREEASIASLEDTIARHGKWTYVRKILSQELVEKKYLEKESSLKGLLSKMAYHKQIEDALKLSNIFSFYTLPHPSRLLEEIQKECKTLSIQEIKDLHSLDLLFSWSLLSPEDFFIKYEKHAKNLFDLRGITAVIADYKTTFKAAQKKTGYSVPHPSTFKKCWLEKNYSLEEIVKNQNINDLITYGVLQNSSFIDSLQTLHQEVKRNEDTFAKNKATIETTYRTDISRAKSTYNNQIALIEMTWGNALNAHTEKNRRISFLQKELAAARLRNDPALIRFLRTELDYATSDRFLKSLAIDAQIFVLNERKAIAQSAYKADIANIEARRKQQLDPVIFHYHQNKKDLENTYQKIKPRSFFFS